MADLLQSELIKLRAMEPEDIEILYRWENDTDIWKVSNTIAPFSKYVLRQFIENQSRDIYETRQLRLIIESRTSGTPVGAIDLFDLDPYNLRAGVGIALLIRYCFQILGLNQLYCNIPADNIASQALFKSKGFRVIGLKKEWIKTTSDWQDEYMLQLLNPKKY